MTTKERFLRAFRHEEADRVPITDSPWNGTLARWRREGMPANADWREYFGADKVETSVWIFPRAIPKRFSKKPIAMSFPLPPGA